MLNLLALALFQISSLTIGSEVVSQPTQPTTPASVSANEHGTGGWTGIDDHGTGGWTGVNDHGTGGWTGK